MSKIELNRIIILHDYPRVRTTTHELQLETKTNYRNILNNLIANIELKTTQKAFRFLCGYCQTNEPNQQYSFEGYIL